MIKTKILFKEKEYPVEFFNDDTIDVIRKQISKSIDIHPDKLFILIGLELPSKYYKQDPRNWERLFNRISLNGDKLLKETFETYIHDLRFPFLNETYQELTKEEWMIMPSKLRDLKENFLEYRIFGVDSLLSYCLPMKEFSDISLKIPSAQYPIPELQTLFLTLYLNIPIKHFIVKEYETFGGPYFPYLTKDTPSYLSENEIKVLEENHKHLKNLFTLEPPIPIITKILKTVWRIPFIDTFFGDIIRQRFEQIFYGLTLSINVPCITLWASRNQISRHKFFKSVNETKPYLDISMWKRWFTQSKTRRDEDILILYRGESRENFDRVTISSTDIIFACYRDNTNTKTINELKKSIFEWFKTFDAIIPFIKESDYAECRFDLQEIKFESFYNENLITFDNSRINCLSGIFSESKTNKTVFRFLRSDHSYDEINARDLKVFSLLKENSNLKYEDLEKELKVSYYEAKDILDSIKKRLEEEPTLLNKEYRKFPILQIKEKSILVEYINDIDRFLKYSNILRYILSNPESKYLDKICPKRLEIYETSIKTETKDIEITDLFDYLEDEPQNEIKEKKEKKIMSGYGYYLNRLQQFDEETFHPSAKFPSKCDRKYQPIILSDKELEDISGTPYDPQKYSEEEKIKIENPDGLIICPEYWCMTDEIPLKESQLVTIEGTQRCPKCKGKLRNIDDKLDYIEYSVLKRDSKKIYPKFSSNISPINQKNLPCCYSTPNQSTKKLETEENIFFIMNEDKINILSFRLAYVPQDILFSIFINETYKIFKKGLNRMQSGMSGYFRVGIQRPSKDLPSLIGKNISIQSPRFSIETIIKCSFLSTWREKSTKYSKEIEDKLSMKPFDKNNKKVISEMISSISEHYESGILNQVYELEYCALLLNIDLFKIDLVTRSISCTSDTPKISLKKYKGIIVIKSGNQLDVLCHVFRNKKKFEYQANVWDEPFTEKTREELIKLRLSACKIKSPSFNNAVLLLKKRSIDTFFIILDPYGRAQAFYVPKKIILPFENTSIPKLKQEVLSGYHEIKELPSYEYVRNFIKGEEFYEWESDIQNKDGFVIEILTKSGFRIPIKPFKSEKKESESQIFETLQKTTESNLLFDEPSKEDLELYKRISYNAEIHDFLLFQLSKDLDDYSELRNVLIENKSTKLEHLLYSWYNEITYFFKTDKPIEFLSKIRKPCGQLKDEKMCSSGNMCAWVENKCKIKIRDTFSKEKVFKNLFRSLHDNSKMRYLVLDKKITPFFSTILYLELPNEIIITDNEIKQFTQSDT